MEQKRILLYVLLIAILFALWEAWQKDYPSTPPVTTTTEAAANSSLPPAAAQSQAAVTKSSNLPTAPATTPAPTPAKHQIVTVDTDVLRVGIDTLGGSLVNLSLPKYPESLDDTDKPVVLLSNNPSSLYLAESGLISSQGPDAEQGQAVLTPEQTQYRLTPGQQTLEVKLTWQNNRGIKVSKIFTFERGKYTVFVTYKIENQSQQPWSGQFYSQLRQLPPPSNHSFLGLHTYQGGAISSSDTPYKKISFSDMEKNNLDKSIQGGWLAFQQRYFLGAWISDPSQTNRYYTRVEPITDPAGSGTKVNTYKLGFVGAPLNVPAGGEGTTGATLYAGPEIADSLAKLAPNLDATIDYGWLSYISIVIFKIMKAIHQWIGNWGWAIVLVTLLIKLVFYWPSAVSYRSMAKMRKLTPQMQAIRERFGDDRQKVGQATMELYKKEKVNPLSGCLPMLIQIPFFIALYYVLIESVELRQSPFIFWIHDLSIRDPYFVLPLLMGLSMFLQQRLNPPPPDPVQAKVFMLMPVIFTVLFATFPAGLVLYWLVNSCVGVLQQWYILRQVERGPAKNNK